MRNFEELKLRSEVFNLADAFRQNLNAPGPLHLWPRDFGQSDTISNFRVAVRGRLKLSADGTDCADCHFVVPSFWMERMPQVMCYDSWLRAGDADWHVFADGRSLCWQYPDFWKKELGKFKTKNDPAATLDYAARWCLNEVRSLLGKHIIADQMNITEWQPEWPAWPHGATAAAADFARRESRGVRGGLFPPAIRRHTQSTEERW